jgi:hypothetical protein
MYQHNIRPKQIRDIPWGWKNKVVGNQVYVVKHPNKVPDIDLQDYFNWNDYDVTDSVYPGDIEQYSSQDMKCLFTTVHRFLGDRLYLMMMDDFDELEGVFAKTYQLIFKWNLRLVYEIGYCLKLFVIGDDIAFNTGLFIHPDLWIELVGRRYTSMVYVLRDMNPGMKVVFHSDGDIFKLMPYLDEVVKVDEVLYEPVGKMEQFKDGDKFGNIKLVEMPIYEQHLGYRRLDEDTDN